MYIDELGAGAPTVLYLHGEYGPAPEAQLVRLLAGGRSVFAPHHPGWGRTPPDPRIDTMGDLVLAYLDLIDTMPDGAIDLVGTSLGGWLAMEIATVYGHRIGRLALLGPVGVKQSAITESDFFDAFAAVDSVVAKATFADPALSPFSTPAETDEDILARAQHQESFVRFGWEPYLYNPKLGQRLARLQMPTLVLAGGSDEFVRPGYYEDLTGRLPAGTLEEVAGSGHFPAIEAPDAAAAAVLAFLS